MSQSIHFFNVYIIVTILCGGSTARGSHMILGGLDASTCWLRCQSWVDGIAVWMWPIRINADRMHIRPNRFQTSLNPVGSENAPSNCVLVFRTLRLTIVLTMLVKRQMSMDPGWDPTAGFSFQGWLSLVLSTLFWFYKGILLLIQSKL